MGAAEQMSLREQLIQRADTITDEAKAQGLSLQELTADALLYLSATGNDEGFIEFLRRGSP